jgi:hypothetical protein
MIQMSLSRNESYCWGVKVPRILINWRKVWLVAVCLVRMLEMFAKLHNFINSVSRIHLIQIPLEV